MKSVVFFVQNNHVLYNSIPVAQYAWRTGHELIDRSSHAEFDPANCGINWDDYDVIIPYGSVQFVRMLAGSVLNEHVYYSPEKFATDHWMTQFGERALNCSGSVATVKDTTTMLQENKLHVRPNNIDKAFVAAVFDVESWNVTVTERELDGHLQCFVSPVRTIAAEYRCWIVDNKIVQISQYMQDGQFYKQSIDELNPIWDEATKLSTVYLPYPTVVMDVAVDDNGKVYFLEFNSIHCSGWYDCDISVVLDKMVEWRTKC